MSNNNGQEGKINSQVYADITIVKHTMTRHFLWCHRNLLWRKNNGSSFHISVPLYLLMRNTNAHLNTMVICVMKFREFIYNIYLLLLKFFSLFRS